MTPPSTKKAVGCVVLFGLGPFCVAVACSPCVCVCSFQKSPLASSHSVKNLSLLVSLSGLVMNWTVVQSVPHPGPEDHYRKLPLCSGIWKVSKRVFFLLAPQGGRSRFCILRKRIVKIVVLPSTDMKVLLDSYFSQRLRPDFISKGQEGRSAWLFEWKERSLVWYEEMRWGKKEDKKVPQGVKGQLSSPYITAAIATTLTASQEVGECWSDWVLLAP